MQISMSHLTAAHKLPLALGLRKLQSLCGTSQCVVNIKLVQLTVNHTQNKTLVTVLFEQQ